MQSHSRPRNHQFSKTSTSILTKLTLKALYGAVRQTQTADWEINEVNIIEECSNRFPIPKLDL